MGWSVRRTTRSAQKFPKDFATQIWKSCLRQAFFIRNHAVPAALRVNSDQTGLVYAAGSAVTWNERGARQVDAIGKDEKRACTLNVGISSDGTLLPFQFILHGKSDRSLPGSSAPFYDKSAELGITYEANPKNHWSDLERMKAYVRNT